MIKITNLNKNFNNRILFNDFNLELDSNKLIFITGPSGSGKTTLLNMIGNIVLPDSGKITYLEKDKEYSLINNKNNVKIGIVFQAFNLLNNLSAFDNLSIAQQINGREIEKHKINSPLENFDLDKEKKILAKNLSSGQQQRLAFLRSLVLENDILLADEPTGNLDS
ncbi:ABC TRANSPORTER ATP-BINDING PROTEIN [Mycoplasmopsis pulmonis]|uniref:ABC TRANSPORTER ATP-BINDING PROTEIN n=1 Tax=Mycoplasmopsis pulmonis (strain UAB CTIP) TaxID=272635 RepID=Q98RE5_MYCPU|nr:ABC transporter ATP-binding protein [Mycoplasmopsis pulmonis]CAC13237.1 ABC TRANSPORTER ATP-BINDING PROTEIN [Mycoplasmopsis pulmonis]